MNLSIIKSIVRLKCPRCHKGNLFNYPNLWRYNHVLDMPPRCDNCHQDFEIEPGFYSGALWTSYPLIILFGIILIAPAFLFPDFIIPILIFFAIAMIIIQPVIMRLGRAIWINVFIHYKKNKN